MNIFRRLFKKEPLLEQPKKEENWLAIYNQKAREIELNLQKYKKLEKKFKNKPDVIKCIQERASYWRGQLRYQRGQYNHKLIDQELKNIE